jgi:TPR repeat protein
MGILVLPVIVFTLLLVRPAALQSTKPFIGAELFITQDSRVTAEELSLVLKGKSKGHKESIYYLGLLYLYGLAVPKDIELAKDNFRSAAALGHVEAHTAFAVLLLNDSSSVTEHSALAVEYLTRAADSNDTNAQLLLAKALIGQYETSKDKAAPILNYLTGAALASPTKAEAHHYLGVVYEYGIGVDQSLTTAIEHYKLSADLSFVESMYNLALMYAYGRGTEQSFGRSGSLLVAAAAAHHGPSMYYLGIMKAYGYGCEVDYVEAARWFRKAASTDDARIYDKAEESARSLEALILQARLREGAALDRYRQQSQRTLGS